MLFEMRGSLIVDIDAGYLVAVLDGTDGGPAIGYLAEDRMLSLNVRCDEAVGAVGAGPSVGSRSLSDNVAEL